ncbi:MAG: leucine-rich repeat domain-containing protein [Clostridia bacterium]|nr:leucine-rich repeat domain-containing protein [Clostridia bacterium]
MKKILSVALVLIMMLSVLSVTASAEAVVMAGYYDAEINDLYYVLYEGEDYAEAYVVGYEADLDNIAPAGTLNIPETVTYQGNEYTVTGVESEAFYQSLFTSITLPDTINYMGDYAFSTCDYLENVVIPEDCHFDYFGYGVFTTTPFEAEIYSKDETIFGENVLYSYIGNADEYVIPEEIDILANNCFFMSGVKSIVINENITEIPYYAFASCRNLTSVDIPDNVEYIYDGAFKDCTSLETITLGEGVAYIGLDCFANTKIKSIHLGQAVYSVFGAFRNCNTLETITIDAGNTALSTDGKAIYFNTSFYFEDVDAGDILVYYLPSKAQGKITLKSDVMMIGAYAFYGCKDLKEVLAEKIYAVDTDAFRNSSIEKFTASDIMMIWDGAFKNCKNLKDIDITTVNTISAGAFENCTALTDVEFSKDIYEIGAQAFANTGLTDVVINGDDCFIEEGAFMNCENLESVRLEDGVYYVGMNAFLNCPELQKIYLAKSVKVFEDNAFNGCDNVTFELIKNTTAYKYIKNNTDFNIKVVGNYSLWQRILDFFHSLFGF